MSTRHYYACSWSPYGVASDDRGNPMRTIYRFISTAERDAWVMERAHVPRTQGGYREALTRRDCRRAEVTQ